MFLCRSLLDVPLKKNSVKTKNSVKKTRSPPRPFGLPFGFRFSGVFFLVVGFYGFFFVTRLWKVLNERR